MEARIAYKTFKYIGLISLRNDQIIYKMVNFFTRWSASLLDDQILY